MNTDTITLSLSLPYIITIGISSGLFAGLISTLGNMLIAYFSQKNERKIETERYRNSINDYRYKEVHKYLKNICDIQSKAYAIQSREDMVKLIEDSNNEYEQVMSIYRMGLPLLDKELYDILSTALNEVETISNALVEQVYINKEKKYDVGSLISARDSFKSGLIDALQKQLVALLLHSKKST